MGFFPGLVSRRIHKFTGKERDSESGLDMFGARYYGSSLGRFMSVTMNTYVQAVTPAKRKAQRGIIKQIREVAPDAPAPRLKCLQVLEMVGAIGFEPMTSTV